MKATIDNSTGVCERCERCHPFVLAAGFNPDGSFRHLCASCERTERWNLQRELFPDVYLGPPKPEPEAEEQPAPDHSNQMGLFAEVQ